MEFSEVISNLNYWAILVAAAACFAFGSIWYMPSVFGNTWMKLNGFTKESLAKGNSPAKAMGGSFILTLIMAFVLAMFIGNDSDAATGAVLGFLVGAPWIAMALGVTYLYESRPTALFFINALYHVITFTIMGAILGAWS